MTDLYWPGDARAGELMTDRALVAALVRVEVAWLEVLVAAGIAADSELPAEGALAELSDQQLAELAEVAEAGGNPVMPLLSVLRGRLAETSPDAARWLHRGLTSQDAQDSALMLMLRDVLQTLRRELAHQVTALRDLAEEHRDTLAAGRTLTQHAVPVTFGLIAASWLDGILDVADDLDQVRSALPAQVGGAAGTLAAITELARGLEGGRSLSGGPQRVSRRGLGDPASRAMDLANNLAARLDLRPGPPWHTNRRPITRVGDVLAAASDAEGRIANDVLVRTRPEIGELSEAQAPGRGGSSTMPHKRNPVLSVLIRRAAIEAPALSAALHAAAAAAVDQRPDGGWHAEWAPLRTLARHTVSAASQATELVTNLVVHADRMREIAVAARDDLLAEARSLRELTGATQPLSDPADYLGATDLLIDAVLKRADHFLQEP